MPGARQIRRGAAPLRARSVTAAGRRRGLCARQGTRSIRPRPSARDRRHARRFARALARLPVGRGHLLYARALEDSGRTEDALAEYQAVTTYYAGAEARV